MLKRLEIKNFKSLKNLLLDCRRVNIFIGKPNTGKSNILETIGLLSHLYYGNLRGFVRFEYLPNLFYDQDIDNEIIIRADLENLKYTLKIMYQNNLFKCYLKKEGVETSEGEIFSYDYMGRGSRVVASEFERFKFYRFTIKDKFSTKDSRFLLPPHGDNLLSILLVNKQLRKLVRSILSEYGFRLVLKPIEDKIEFEKEYEEIVISYPYSLLSDTLQRIIFHLVAIESNKDSVIAFEEPEAHAFPYYTKFLAERIALDQNNNQYFISTHNPYFLLSIIEKTRLNELAVFITYYQDYQTRVKQLSEEEIEKILDLGPDVFFNIELFIEGNK